MSQVQSIATAAVCVLHLCASFGFCAEPFRTFRQHIERVTSVAFSPDGKALASGSGKFTGLLQSPQPGEAVVWLDVRAGFPRVLLGGHADGVSCMKFSPDGSTLASASYDGTVNLWNAQNWERIATVEHGDAAVTSVAFSPDQKSFATGGWGGNMERAVHEIKLWDGESMEQTGTLAGHPSGVTSVAFSPDSKWLVAGCENGTASVWNVKTRELKTELAIPDKQWVESIAFNGTGELFAIGTSGGLSSQTGRISLWRTSDWSMTTKAKASKEDVPCVAFAPDGKSLAACGQGGQIQFLDPTNLTTLRTLESSEEGDVASLAFSPDGKMLAAGKAKGVIDLWLLPARTNTVKQEHQVDSGAK